MQVNWHNPDPDADNPDDGSREDWPDVYGYLVDTLQAHLEQFPHDLGNPTIAVRPVGETDWPGVAGTLPLGEIVVEEDWNPRLNYNDDPENPGYDGPENAIANYVADWADKVLGHHDYNHGVYEAADGSDQQVTLRDTSFNHARGRMSAESVDEWREVPNPATEGRGFTVGEQDEGVTW